MECLLVCANLKKVFGAQSRRFDSMYEIIFNRERKIYKLAVDYKQRTSMCIFYLPE